MRDEVGAKGEIGVIETYHELYHELELEAEYDGSAWDDDMSEIIAKWRQDPANDEAGWFCSVDEA